MRRFRIALAACLTALAVATTTGLSVPAGFASPPSERSYIVTLKDGVDPAAAAKRFGVKPSDVYRDAVNGYAAVLNKAQVEKVSADPSTVSVGLDQTFTSIDPSAPRIKDPPTQLPQFVTAEIRRVGGLASTTAKIDGVDERIDVDVAVIDSGVDVDHPDLNVAGVKNCVSHRANTTGFHGTMVAGQIGAIDNAIGIVGIAPGARIWSVSVAGNEGTYTTSRILCALDWVAAHSDVIDVVNMSYGGFPKSISTCPDPVYSSKKNAKPDAEHEALCTLDQEGIVLVAAAGNQSTDEPAAPAAYPEVISVSAMVDFDGLPGGLSSPRPICFPDDVDDTFAVFSNFGETIDIAAPGVCNVSTYPGGYYAAADGTSFAAPLVAGGAALLLANNPNMTPAQVRAAILDAAEPGPIPGDPDNFPEGVLNVSEF